MNLKKYAAAVCALLMAAGCSSAPAGNQTDSNKTDTSSTPESINALMTAADGDDAAYEAWEQLLKNTVDHYNGSLSMDCSGDDYLYKDTKDQEMVKEDFLYDIGRDVEIKKASDSTVAADLTDVDDSYDAFISGFGSINRYGKDAVSSSVKLENTSDDSLKGTITAVSQDTQIEEAFGDEETMIDALVNYGYVRTVDPIHNASLYKYEVAEKDGDWQVTAKIKDLDAFKKHATVKAVLTNNQNNLPVLVMDQIEEDSFTFTFDKDGVLKSSQNQVYHVINGFTPEHEQTFMNLDNKTEIKASKSDDIHPEAFDEYFKGLADGTLKAGDSFEITGWK